jgi:DNA-binding transcriptional LysR family regulator
VTIADTSEIEALVLEGKLELGVIGAKGSHKSLMHRELWNDELVLVVPARHRWAKRRSVSPRELFEEPFVMREVGSGTLSTMEDYLHESFKKESKTLRVVARFGSSTAVKEGIKAGLGVSILSSRALHTELKAGILKALRVTNLRMTRSFFLIRDKRRIASPPCQALLDFLLDTSNE